MHSLIKIQICHISSVDWEGDTALGSDALG